MASTTNSPALIERADIHKSCKSLETVLAALTNYTETATALASAQKKLAKALREAANVKGTNNVPGDAMTASAGIFDTLSEIDTKFSKIADKEAENIGNEVKKWFKKLAKEEKGHDERMANMNARIKQAGQAYEKKAKQKQRDVGEEHTRYVALLNSLGPEMQQEKYNHALLVTQRHTSTLSEFAAALARLAEAEWFRACEQVRKFAPCVGNLGEWRVMCEGGWSGSVPPDLPDVDKAGNDAPMERQQTSVELSSVATRSSQNVSEHSDSLSNSLTSRLPSTLNEVQPTMEARLAPPPATTTVRDIPPQPARQQTSNSDDVSRSPAKPASMAETSSVVETPAEDPPAKHPEEQLKVDVEDKAPSKASPLPSPAAEERPRPRRRETIPAEEPVEDGTIKASDKALGTLQEEEEFRELPKPLHPTEDRRPPETDKMEEVRAALERSERNNSPAEVAGRRNSLVATMRERYDSRPDPPPASPPPRDLPRSPKVTDLASRYTPLEMPIPTRAGTSGTFSSHSLSSASSDRDRFTTFQERYQRRGPPTTAEIPRHQRDYFDETDEPLMPVQGRYSAASTPVRQRGEWEEYNLAGRGTIAHSPERERMGGGVGDRVYYDEMGRRIGRMEQIETEMALEEREASLRERERQLEMERRRLNEWDRERSRDRDRESGYTSDNHGRIRGGGYTNDIRGTSPYSTPAAPGPSRRYSASPQPMSSTTSLTSPAHPALSQPHRSPPRAHSPLPIPEDHSPSCGCHRCSVQHYTASSKNSEPVVFKPEPPIKLRPEKPKGWFRRMSMDVAGIVGGEKDKERERDPRGGAVSPTGSAVGGAGRHIAVPPEDTRVRRRSFEGQQGQGQGQGQARYPPPSAYSGYGTERRY